MNDTRMTKENNHLNHIIKKFQTKYITNETNKEIKQLFKELENYTVDKAIEEYTEDDYHQNKLEEIQKNEKDKAAQTLEAYYRNKYDEKKRQEIKNYYKQYINYNKYQPNRKLDTLIYMRDNPKKWKIDNTETLNMLSTIIKIITKIITEAKETIDKYINMEYEEWKIKG